MMGGLSEAPAVLGGGVGGAALAIGALKVVEAIINKRQSPEQKMGEAAGAASELIELALKASGTSVEQLLREVADLRGELVEAREEIAGLHRAHATCEADARRLEGELNQQRQITESLSRELRKTGIEVSDLTGTRPLIVIEAKPEEKKT